MSREGNETYISLEVATRLVVFLDSHKASILAVCSRVRLKGDVIILSDCNKAILKLFNHLKVPLNLIFGGEWVDATEAFEGNGKHFNSRVQLKGARAEGDHGVSEANILICKSLNVAHHLGLTGDLLKLRLF